MSFTIAEDIKTLLLANFDASKVTAIEELQSDSNLLVYLGFDNNLNDLSGNDNIALGGSTTAYVTGKTGQAVSFDGTANSTVTSNKVLTGTAVTISFWLYWDGTKNNALDYFYALNSTDIVVSATANNQITVAVIGTGSNVAYAAFVDKWTHIYITLDYQGAATIMNVWVDNVQKVTDSDKGAKAFPTSGDHYFGADATDTFLATIYMDTFRIYNTVLSAGEKTNLFNLLNPDGTAYFNSIDPVIRLIDDDPDPNDRGFPIIGEIVIGREQFLRLDPFSGYRSETFLVDIVVSYQEYTATSPARIKSIVAEIDRVLDAESLTHDTYYYKIRYDWLGSYREGVMKLQVEVLNALTIRPSLV